MNNFVLQHKMDKVKVEHDSISGNPPPFLSSEREFHNVNYEGPVSFDMLRNGAKVRFFFFLILLIMYLTYMRRNCSVCMGSCVCLS